MSEQEIGRKDDNGKSPIFQGVLNLFPRALEGVATVSAFGANKYSWDNWSSLSNGFERYSDAMARHLLKEGIGNGIDSDTRSPHILSTSWNSLARCELYLRRLEKDGMV